MAPKPTQTDDDMDLRDVIAALQAQVADLARDKVAAGGLTEDRLEAILLKVTQVSAEAHERAANPSNRSSKGISPFSYPEGDALRPRVMKCEMLQNGYDQDLDTTTAREIELMNLAQPGTYTFRRLNGQPETLTVEGDRNPDGTLRRLKFEFPNRENRDTLPTWTAMLQQAFGVKTPEQQELETLRMEVEALRVKAYLSV